MEDSKKDGNIAGAIFLFVGVLALVMAFDQGIAGSGKTTGIVGALFSLIGIGSFVSPNVAETVVHWLKGLNNSEKVSQTQHKPKNSPQVYNHGGKVIINQNINRK